MKTNLSILTLCAAVAFGSATMSAREYGYANDENFSDLTLINCGDGEKRAQWTEDDFEPYLTHKYADGHESWFFDAFLFVDTQRGNKKFGNDIPGVPASQADWKWMLDQFFDPELKLHALDNLIDKKKETLGTPPLQHRIVLSLCLPCKASDGNWPSEPWGKIDGSFHYLNTLENRLTAMKWYIDEMVTRFAAENYKNLELAGVYWIEEGIWTNTDLVTLVNEYVHEKGLRSYWIPYYKDNSSSWSKAHSYKFDVTYLQPNYAFGTGDDALPYSILTDCCNYAKTYVLGLELEFETILTSSAMHSDNPELHQRINDYMDVFEETGVTTSGAIAYYSGSQGFIDMAKSEDPVDHATIDRMADIVAKRQAAKAQSGIEDAVVTHAQIAYAGEGCIYICDKDPEVKCYDVSGRTVHTGAGKFYCSPGLYIVASPSSPGIKLLVK